MNMESFGFQQVNHITIMNKTKSFSHQTPSISLLITHPEVTEDYLNTKTFHGKLNLP